MKTINISEYQDAQEALRNRNFAQALYEQGGVIMDGAKTADQLWVETVAKFDAVSAIARAVEPFDFERLYGIWRHWIVTDAAHSVVQQSAARYMRAIGR